MILSLKGLVGRATEPPWLVVPDTSIIVRGVVGASGQPSQQLLEAAVGGLYLPVVSDHLRNEVTEVLQRSKFGYSLTEAQAVLKPFWEAARFVELATFDEAYLRFVHDPKDVFLIQCRVVGTGRASNAAPRGNSGISWKRRSRRPPASR